MAKLSDAVSVLARVSGRPEHEVAIHARRAREAGLIVQGGRGNSAADVRVRDLANLLLTFNGAEYAKDAKQTIKRYRKLVAEPIYLPTTSPKMLEAMRKLEALEGTVPSSFAFLRENQHSFGDALEQILLSAARGDLKRDMDRFEYKDLWITMSRPVLKASISLERLTGPKGLSKTRHYQVVGGSYDGPLVGTKQTVHDRETSISITQKTLFALGELVREPSNPEETVGNGDVK
jgi:hypothetical protein